MPLPWMKYCPSAANWVVSSHDAVPPEAISGLEQRLTSPPPMVAPASKRPCTVLPSGSLTFPDMFGFRSVVYRYDVDDPDGLNDTAPDTAGFVIALGSRLYV